MGEPVCTTCDDTHSMNLGELGTVMCTHCPVPCKACQMGDQPYCKATPCRCTCHTTTAAYKRYRAAISDRNLSCLLNPHQVEMFCAKKQNYEAADHILDFVNHILMLADGGESKVEH